ncbi:MAG: carboxypeptidase-like regulatory domain-containing protein [Bacteroidota bacterium]
MKHKLLFVLFITLVIFSCRKDDISDGLINQPPEPTVFYESDIIGRVVDDHGNPISDVQISSGQQFAKSGIDGLFKFEGLSIDKVNGAYLSAQAFGYFSGGYRIYTRNANDRQIEITLVEKELSGYVNSTKSESISLDNGLSIDFPAQGFTLDGEDYSGLVAIYAYHIDPSQEGYLDLSPGDLSGSDDTNTRFVLESFGMIAVEMEAGDGRPVQLKEGSKATIRVPVDASLLVQAPQEIALWHFDEDRNIWMKEGSADLIDGFYVGEVSHFSWWNCDAFAVAADLCVQIVDARFIGSLSGFFIELSTDDLGASSVVTDSDGFANGIVPANEIIDITIYDACGNEVYTGSIGPFEGTDNKEVIYLTLTQAELYYFAGTITDCESTETLANSIVRITIEGVKYYTETTEDGSYAIAILACQEEGSSYSAAVFNVEEGVSGTAEGVIAANQTNILDLNLCNEAPIFIIDGNIINETEVFARRRPTETVVFTDPEINTTILAFEGFTVGTFPAVITAAGYISINVTVEISQYDDVGGIVKGTFQGINELNSSPFEGSFVAIVEE